MASQLDQAKQALGQLFIIGFQGLDLSDETAAFISQARIGGVIYFAHNYDTPAQIAELSNQIQECRAPSDLPLWISVDHEGGRVQRFRKGFTKIPEAAAIAALNSPKRAYDIAEMMGKELSAVGVNLNFAPVADINTNPKNPVIGARAFGSDEDQVSKMVTAVVRGHLVSGVQACVKHFPGHGDTQTDSHFALPKVSTSLETLVEREFKPFIKAFKSRCGMVMSAHVLIPSLDPDYPATLSKKILRGVLRGDLRYSRVIVTDDMEMKAITDHFGAEQAPLLAIEAGCDVLCYRSEATARHAYASVLKALDEGRLDPTFVLESEARIRELKQDSLLPYAPVAVQEVGSKVGTPENLALVADIVETQKR